MLRCECQVGPTVGESTCYGGGWATAPPRSGELLPPLSLGQGSASVAPATCGGEVPFAQTEPILASASHPGASTASSATLVADAAAVVASGNGEATRIVGARSATTRLAAGGGGRPAPYDNLIRALDSARG